ARGEEDLRGQLHDHPPAAEGDLELAGVDHLPELLGELSELGQAVLDLGALGVELLEAGLRRRELLAELLGLGLELREPRVLLLGLALERREGDAALG